MSKEAGFYVVERDGKTIRFEEGWQPELHPSGALAVLEMVPDVGNRNRGAPIPEVRVIYGHRGWDKIIMATPDTERRNDKDD